MFGKKKSKNLRARFRLIFGFSANIRYQNINIQTWAIILLLLNTSDDQFLAISWPFSFFRFSRGPSRGPTVLRGLGAILAPRKIPPKVGSWTLRGPPLGRPKSVQIGEKSTKIRIKIVLFF